LNIVKGCFGKTKKGETVTKYTLVNDHGYSVSVLNYGGIINEILVPDRHGIIKNVVLGYNNIVDYEENAPYFGCITGRTAGRIKDATFSIGEDTYVLGKNDGNNNLHGGFNALDKTIWNITEVVEKDVAMVSLNYMSPHLEEGYPGNVDIIVSYKWDNTNQLSISYRATTDQETIINLTNHSYFNLSGDFSTDILDHTLQIEADRFIQLRKDLTPEDISEVKDTPFDFRVAKTIGQDINENNRQLMIENGYDHPFILDSIKRPQITLAHERSGRKLSITTDETCVVCYTGNFLNAKFKAYDEVPLKKSAGVCLETQYYPDSQNFKLVPSKTLKPYEAYLTVTSYHFTN